MLSGPWPALMFVLIVIAEVDPSMVNLLNDKAVPAQPYGYKVQTGTPQSAVSMKAEKKSVIGKMTEFGDVL
jgi:hypothetical protein